MQLGLCSAHNRGPGAPQYDEALADFLGPAAGAVYSALSLSEKLVFEQRKLKRGFGQLRALGRWDVLRNENAVPMGSKELQRALGQPPMQPFMSTAHFGWDWFGFPGANHAGSVHPTWKFAVDWDSRWLGLLVCDACVRVLVCDACVRVLVFDACVRVLVSDACVRVLVFDACVRVLVFDACVRVLVSDACEHCRQPD